MLKKISLALLVLVAVVLMVLRFHKVPAPLAEESVAAAVLAPGEFEVLWEDVEFEDSTRKTPAHGDYKGADSRRFTARIWYPRELVEAPVNDRRPQPLLIYSHGFMSTRTGGAYLANYFASHGWMVVSADYPLTHFSAPGGPWVRDVVNQPGDLSHMLDRLIAWSAQAGHRFEAVVDVERIAAAGLSLGGMTTTLAAYHPTLGDPRIAVAVSIAGPTEFFAPAFFRHRQLPFMMVATDQDAMVNYNRNAARVIADVPNAVLVTIAGGSHTGFGAQSSMLRWLDNADSLGCNALSKNLDSEDDSPWYQELGSAEQGIRERTVNDLCATDPLPPAMNPLLQQRFNTLAVGSFLRSHFDPDPDLRNFFRSFLRKDFAAGFDAVTVSTAD